MNIITNLDEANELLDNCENYHMRVYLYSASLKRMALRLWKTNSPNVLFLVGVSCEKINGMFYLNDAQMHINIQKIDSLNDITIIADRRGQFELITTGGFALAIGNQDEFGDSFDNFIKDHI